MLAESFRKSIKQTTSPLCRTSDLHKRLLSLPCHATLLALHHHHVHNQHRARTQLPSNMDTATPLAPPPLRPEHRSLHPSGSPALHHSRLPRIFPPNTLRLIPSPQVQTSRPSRRRHRHTTHTGLRVHSRAMAPHRATVCMVTTGDRQ